jgi:hypothetical protein
MNITSPFLYIASDAEKCLLVSTGIDVPPLRGCAGPKYHKPHLVIGSRNGHLTKSLSAELSLLSNCPRSRCEPEKNKTSTNGA